MPPRTNKGRNSTGPISEPPTALDAAKENPFRFFTLEEVGEMFGFGKDVMTAIAAAGAPIVARKCNPQLLLKWLGEHAAEIPKTTCGRAA